MSFSIFFRDNEKQVEETNLHYLERDSDSLAQQLDVKFQDSLDYLKNMAFIFEDSTIEELDEMQSLFETMSKDAPFDEAYFIYSDGNTWDLFGEKVDLSEREYFKEAMKGKEGISEPFMSPLISREIFICYVPVRSENGIQAVLSGIYYRETLEAMGADGMDPLRGW